MNEGSQEDWIKLKRLYLFLLNPEMFQVNIFRRKESFASDKEPDMSELFSLKRKISERQELARRRWRPTRLRCTRNLVHGWG